MMNTINESSELSSSKIIMAPTTTFLRSTKKGLAVLAALCMLSFYTGHLSRGGEQSSTVSLLRNGVRESGGVTTTNGISDYDGVGILSTKSHPCKFDNTACLSFTAPCIESCPVGLHRPLCLRACHEERVQICQEYPKTRAAEVRNRTPNSCDWYCGTCCLNPSLCTGLFCSHLFCNGDTVFPPGGNFDRTCHAKVLDGCPAFYNYKP